MGAVKTNTTKAQSYKFVKDKVIYLFTLHFYIIRFVDHYLFFSNFLNQPIIHVFQPIYFFTGYILFVPFQLLYT